MRKLIALPALLLCLTARGEEPPGDAPERAGRSEPARAAAATREPVAIPPRPPPVQRFWLFPELEPLPPPPLDLGREEGNKRLFHQPGDPDSLFTFGEATPEGELRLKAAIEVNDIVLKALPPDFRIDPSDTHLRAAGSFSALDSHGRPYQLRLGARLVW